MKSAALNMKAVMARSSLLNGTVVVSATVTETEVAAIVHLK